MEDRTRAYLRGRFRDHYRRQSIDPPPDAERREWGYIPFGPGGTTMVRHQSLYELGELGTFLQRERPQHVYFSAGRYTDPGAPTMDEKVWQGSDLVFDLDADHLPGVDPDRTSYAEMLAACKDALYRLVDFLERDFGFEDLTIVFSGGRGYHVHVRDQTVQQLDRTDRREIVEYVRGIDVDFEQVSTTETVGGTVGRKTPAKKRLLRTDGGWGRRVHQQLLEEIERLATADHATATEELQTYDGIGEEKARAILTVIENSREAIEAGNIDLHTAFVSFVQEITETTVRTQRAPIDEPVTTDTHRLIRLPGSLHGGSGLEVTRIERSRLDAFEPLVDAIPETFVGSNIAIDVTDLTEVPPWDEPLVGKVELGGDSFTITEGPGSYPEYLGIFLMARGHAEKDKE